MQGEKISTKEELDRVASGFMSSRVVLSAFELGIFSALGPEGAGSAQVAQRLGLDARGADRLMNACVVMGLLNKQDGRFTNSGLAAQYLHRDSPDYMAGLGHIVQLWNGWHTLSDAVRAGSSVRERKNGSRDTKSFIAAMHSRARQTAPKLVEHLDLSRVKRALDLGGGSGAMVMELCRAQKDLRATVLDTGEVIPLTRRYVEEAGLSGRIDCLEGDFTKDEYGTGYDLIILSAIMHIYSPDQNTGILKRCARALNPGGRAVIRDFLVNPERDGPNRAVMFALNMLVNTEAGDSYSEQEISSWLKTAGFGAVERIDLDQQSALVIGTKLN